MSTVSRSLIKHSAVLLTQVFVFGFLESSSQKSSWPQTWRGRCCHASGFHACHASVQAALVVVVVVLLGDVPRFSVESRDIIGV